MEAVLTSLSTTNKTLEGLSARHQTHATKLQQLRSALDSMLTDVRSVAGDASVVEANQDDSSAALAQLQAQESSIEQRIREDDVAIETDAERLRAAQLRLQSEVELRWKQLANEYLAALKTLK